MICSVPKMISISSDYFELAAGDVTMIGTPVGINSHQSGNVFLAFIEGHAELNIVVEGR